MPAVQGGFTSTFVEGIPLVEVRGDLDLTNVRELERVLERAARTDRHGVIVSLAGTAYFDSKGVHALLRFAERLATTRQRLMVVAPRGESARRILEIAGVVELMPVYESVQEALGSVHHQFPDG